MHVGRTYGSKLWKRRRDLLKFGVFLLILLLFWWILLKDKSVESERNWESRGKSKNDEWKDGKSDGIEATAIILIDSLCLESIASGLACRAPLEVAVSSHSHVANFLPNSANLKVSHKMITSDKQNYILFEEIKGRRKRRAVPSHLSFQFQSVPIVNQPPQLLLVPSNPSAFRYHWQHSLFIDCLHLKMKRKEAKREIELNRVKLFETVFNYMDERETEVFLMSGSLLGWYRECSLIPHTYDLDLAIKIDQLNEDLIAEIENDFEMKHKLGHINDTLELSFYGDADGPPIDLFVMYNYNDTFEYFTVFDFELLASDQCLYPNIRRLCTGDLHGILVKIPCNVEEILKSEYGPRWSVDVPSYSYNYLQASNVQLFKNYTVDEFDRLYVRYEYGTSNSNNATLQLSNDIGELKKEESGQNDVKLGGVVHENYLKQKESNLKKVEIEKVVEKSEITNNGEKAGGAKDELNYDEQVKPEVNVQEKDVVV